MGSLALGAVGAGIGSIFPGGAMIGFSVGEMLGGILFPNTPRQERGKLDDLRVSGSGYGTIIPLCYGQGRVAGNIIWSTDLVQHQKNEGGGKGGPNIVDDTYTVSCAVSICRGPISSVQRILAEDLVIYDSSQTPASTDTIRIYLGDETQTADTLISSIEGASVTPAYRGTAYVVFENLDLTRWGSHIPSFNFEFTTPQNTVGAVLTDVATQAGLSPSYFDFSSATDTFSGYMITQRTDAKSTVQYLLQCYTTDLSEIDGKIYACKRGTAQTLTVPQDDMGARIATGNSTPITRLTTERTQDLELPVRIDVNYFSLARNFQASTQSATREDKPSLTEPQTLDTPLVFDDTSARQFAYRALWQLWLERNTYKYALPPKYLLQAPACILNLPTGATTDRTRIMAMDIGFFGELRLSSVPDSDTTLASSYTAQPATGASVTGTAPKFNGLVPTAFVAWSGYELQNGDADKPGFYVVGRGTGTNAASWQGASIYYSLDSGANWIASPSSLGTPADFGAATTALANGTTADTLDSSHTVDVHLTGGTLATTSTADISATQNNSAVLGGEIIQFATVTNLGSGSYRLSNIIRGRRSSPMTGHTSADKFIHLNPSSAIVRVNLPASAIGTNVLVKCLSPGQAIGDVTAQSVTIAANHPVYAAYGTTGGATTLARNTATVATSSLANGATDATQRLTTGKAGVLLIIATDVPARVILYETETARTSDSSRVLGTKPARGSGVIAEVVTQAGALAVGLSPTANFENVETPVVGTLPIAVTNLSGAASVVNVTITKITLES